MYIKYITHPAHPHPHPPHSLPEPEPVPSAQAHPAHHTELITQVVLSNIFAAIQIVPHAPHPHPPHHAVPVSLLPHPPHQLDAGHLYCVPHASAKAATELDAGFIQASNAS